MRNKYMLTYIKKITALLHIIKFMDPTLIEGAKDMSRRTGHIYVIRTNDNLVLKRPGQDDGDNSKLISDRPD